MRAKKLKNLKIAKSSKRDKVSIFLGNVPEPTALVAKVQIDYYPHIIKEEDMEFILQEFSLILQNYVAQSLKLKYSVVH